MDISLDEYIAMMKGKSFSSSETPMPSVAMMKGKSFSSSETNMPCESKFDRINKMIEEEEEEDDDILLKSDNEKGNEQLSIKISKSPEEEDEDMLLASDIEEDKTEMDYVFSKTLEEVDEDMLLESGSEEAKNVIDNEIRKGQMKDLREVLNTKRYISRDTTFKKRRIYTNKNTDSPSSSGTQQPRVWYKKIYRPKKHAFVNKTQQRNSRNFNHGKRKNYQDLITKGRIISEGNRDERNNFIRVNRSRNEELVEGPPRNMVIQMPNSINVNGVAPLKCQMPQSTTTEIYQNINRISADVTPQARDHLDLNMGSNNVSNSNKTINSLLGIEGQLTADMIHIFAAKLLALMKNEGQTTVHKPVYDMKIQQDIHEIQNKPLVYECNGHAGVLSSSGTGVDCSIEPETSGIPLNYRFS